jgi:hypothetical protein
MYSYTAGHHVVSHANKVEPAIPYSFVRRYLRAKFKFTLRDKIRGAATVALCDVDL